VRFLLIIITSGLIACSPQARFDHLVKKHPYVLDDFIISQWDTVFVAGVTHDTLFRLTAGGRDTFFISKTNTTIIHNNGELGVSTRQPTDTILLQREYYTKDSVANDNNRLIYIALTILTILVLFLGGYLMGTKK